MLVIKNNEQLEAERLEQEGMLSSFEPVVSSLVGQVHAAWRRNRDAKSQVTEELLRCLRQSKGEYDPEEIDLIKQNGGGNEIYMMLTATKINAAISWLQDVLLPSDVLPVGVEPTPVPELPPEVDSKIVQAVAMALQQEIAQAQEQGIELSEIDIEGRIDAVRSDVMRQVRDKAKERAEKMTSKILDVMEEGGFREAMEDYLSDFATYPTAIMKGPVFRQKTKVSWAEGWRPVPVRELTVTFERVSPFDVFPSPFAKDAHDGDFIERIRMTRSQIYDLKGRPGYESDAIDRVLSSVSGGSLNNWLWSDHERDELNYRGNRHDSGLIDALQYWGFIEGHKLEEWGMRGLEPYKPYHIEALVIGNECIKVALVDDVTGSRPYHIASMFGKPDSFWGEALPKRMRNTQKLCNSIARSIADNLAVSSGPQVVVNVDALADGEDITNVFPWKIWQVSYSQDSAGAKSPIDFYQPSANTGELISVYRHFELKADDETGVPRYAYGNERVGGAGSTASGLSMLFESASKSIRKAISSIDSGIMRPIVHALWLDEMIYGDDMDIKGDGRIVARGAAALLIKDQAQQRRLEFLQMTSNELDMEIIGLDGRAAILREMVAGMDMPVEKLIPSDDEIKQRLAQQQQQPDPRMMIEQAKLEIEQAKAQGKQEIDEQELMRKAQKDAQDYELASNKLRLDTARYLSGEEQKEFSRAAGLLGNAQAGY